MTGAITKHAGGRPPLKFSAAIRGEVVRLAGLGVPFKQIADSMGVNKETLRNNFGVAMMRARVECNEKIAKRLFDRAMEGDNACLIFWAKTQMGWRDVSQIEHIGEGGGPIRIERVIVDTPRLVFDG